jgi:proline-specific peptidase
MNWFGRAPSFWLLLALTACGGEAGLSPGEGYLEVPGGRVWYRIEGSGTATPLLLLHGGPGATHHYLKPLAALADERPVIFYDQLGSGRSDRPTDTTLWRVERFVEELAAVRQALGLDEVHLLGHSWGAMLAVDYLLTKPAGVRSVILASPALSTARWVADADSLVRTMPDSIQAVIAKHEAAGTTTDPEYQAAVIAFYQRYLARRQPWSADLDSTMRGFGTPLYNYMWGPSEFTATGTLQSYDRTDRLSELTLPVLFTTGRHDEAVPGTVAFYQMRVPGARLVVLDHSAHLTMQDEPERNVEIVRQFLHDVEAR